MPLTVPDFGGHLFLMTKTTWDGLPASTVPPFGTAVLVYRWVSPEPTQAENAGASAAAVPRATAEKGEAAKNETPVVLEILLLHRARLGSDFAGDWAWTPPTGCRFPDESIKMCAARELYEECGLKMPIDFAANFGDDEWHMYRAEAAAGAQVQLIDPEHDRFEWVDAAEAIRRCEPAAIKHPLAVTIAALQSQKLA